MLKLEVIIGSTRPGRAGLAIGTWFYEFAQQDGRFDVALADLAVIDLPFIDEPFHPRLHKYEHQHTKDWSARVEAADAFVIVTPEYDFSMSPVVLNAIDYLSSEWKYKVAGIVSYGGVSAGTRAAQMTKAPLTAVGVMPIPEAVQIPFFNKHLTDGVFHPVEETIKAAAGMLTELYKYAEALKSIRSQ